MVYVIVVIKIACHAPRNILNISDILYQPHNNNNNNNDTFSPPWLLDISHFLLTISSSITVILFTVKVSILSNKNVTLIMTLGMKLSWYWSWQVFKLFNWSIWSLVPFYYFPGWVVGWVAELSENKAISALKLKLSWVEAELGNELKKKVDWNYQWV